MPAFGLAVELGLQQAGLINPVERCQCLDRVGENRDRSRLSDPHFRHPGGQVAEEPPRLAGPTARQLEVAQYPSVADHKDLVSGLDSGLERRLEQRLDVAAAALMGRNQAADIGDAGARVAILAVDCQPLCLIGVAERQAPVACPKLHLGQHREQVGAVSLGASPGGLVQGLADQPTRGDQVARPHA